MSAEDIAAFVRHIEYTLFEGQEVLSADLRNRIVQFNIHRKQLLEQLTTLLVNHNMVLGTVFKRIPQYMGMFDMMVNGKDAHDCFVSGVSCERGRHVVLCEKINPMDQHCASFTFFVRSDIFKFIRFFYFIQHFNFYVSRLLVRTEALERVSYDQDSDFVRGLVQKYHFATTELMNIVLVLENASMI